MSLHPRRLVPLALLFVAALGAGCGQDRATGPAASSTALAPSGAAVRAAELTAARARARIGHPWFPLTPGRYVDFRIRRLGEDPEVTYLRATLGEPEMFFGRLATPMVYGESPGRPIDESFQGLRQYFSVAPDGALWSHGAQNRGVLSHTEPPLRQLLADPAPGQVWEDSVYFESFFLGSPYYSNHETYSFSLSETAELDLEGGRFKALRVSTIINDTYVGGAALAAAAFDGLLLTGAGHVPRTPPPALKGPWFARHQGLVARDWPFGPGPGNNNIVTLERIGDGFGPIPAPEPAP